MATNARSRGQFHAGRGTDYRQQMVEMHISEIGFCSRPLGLRRVGQREGRDQREGPLRRRRHGRGAAQLHARRLHLWLVRRAQRPPNTCAGRAPSARSTAPRSSASVRGSRRRVLREQQPAGGAGGRHAAPAGQRLPATAQGDPQDGIGPATHPGHRRGPGADQGGQPPRADARPGSQRYPRLRGRWPRAPRCSAPRAAGACTTTGWTHPRRDDAAWFCHAHLKKDEEGRMASFRKPVEPLPVRHRRGRTAGSTSACG